MKTGKNFGFYIGFIAASLIFLIIERITHIEFLLHLAAIPLEVMVAVFIVEKLLERREGREKRRQLMFIKSYLFRGDMRDLFLANFEALAIPPITLEKIRNANLDELKKIRLDAEKVEYRTPEAMEPVIMEYVKAKPVWMSFLERAITFNFEDIFRDMIVILHFICDVKSTKERNPGSLFIWEAQKQEWLMKKTMKVLGDGIRKFLDYAVELKEKQPHIFDEVISDYELCSRMRPR